MCQIKYRIDKGNYKNFVYMTFVIRKFILVTLTWKDLQDIMLNGKE